MSSKESGINIHEEWKGMTQPVGLVVEPIVLDRLGIFPEKSIKVISDLQRRLESLLEEQIEKNETYTAVTNFKDFCIEVLNWQESDLIKGDEFHSYQSENQIFVELEDYGEILKPDWIVPEINKQDNKKNIQILVKELKLGTSFNDIFNDPENKKRWEATHQQRFERLLKDSENPLGLIWNGTSLRLVYAPRGESSGHITFPLEPMISVDGRPMIGALEMLLGPDRLFEAGASNLRLKTLMEQSRKEQNEVGTRLSEQVLEALWILVRGFDEAEDKSKLSGKSILKDLPDKNPNHVYGGLLTILLRLVFLLYVEDEELMPQDSVYVQNYSVSGLAAKLRADRIKHQSGMEGRYGAWSSLLSLFRLVYDGGGPFESYLPARHGELFDPDAYSFLEGRLENSSYNDGKLDSLPLVSDDVIERVLNKLLILDGQLLSYRSLDVEQIGSVYESIMGFTVEKTKGLSVGVLYTPPRQKIKITYVFNAEELLDQLGSKREGWLKKGAGVDLRLSSTVKKNLKNAENLDDLCQALGPKLSPHTPRGLERDSLILQPTLERRRSGSHYTPRSLTEPIVEETFRPWLKELHFKPSVKDLMSLKVCDPAMGSGAFLVAVCRFLANHLVMAWEREGYPFDFDKNYDKDIYARRLIAQNCIYGVDRNSFAVSLAKLSLWLVTLSKDLPFTFVDHALKTGNSLVGYSLKEIQIERKYNQLTLVNRDKEFLVDLTNQRQRIFSEDNSNDKSYDFKKVSLREQFKATEILRQAGDLLVASFFGSRKAKGREEKKEIYMSLLNDSLLNNSIKETINHIRNDLNSGEKGIKPFHWDLEFPEVFTRERKGFDVFIGNPPFAGKNTIASGNPEGIIDWLKNLHSESHGNADLVSHFYRRCFNLLRDNGSLGLIATNTIAQGDTRSTGLRWICLNGGTIFSAIKRYKWPGVAAVNVSIVHIIKSSFIKEKKLDGRKVNEISAFLLSQGGHEDPKPLLINSNKCYQGSIVYGMGFTFDDSCISDNDTPGIPSPISTMKTLVDKNKKNLEVISPYIGGEEVNSSPSHSYHRYVIDFGNKSEEECRSKWPDLFRIVETKVKPEREKVKDNMAKTFWWRHLRSRNELYKSIKGLKKVLVTNASASLHYTQEFLEVDCIFANSLNIFNFRSENEFSIFSILQSRIHEEYARYMCSTLEDRLRYNPSDCFVTFPFPKGLFDEDEKDVKSELNELESTGKKYHLFRTNLMNNKNEGLTNIYNRFNNPNENDSSIMDLRNLHNIIDEAVIALYGWNDIEPQYGFGLDYLDLNEDLQIPENLMKKINSEDIFFLDKDQASLFEKQLHIITKTKVKLSWRYRWPNSLKEDIVSRLLSLNIIRYEEEVKEGLHVKGPKGFKKGNKLSSKKISKISKSDEQYEIDLNF